MITQYDQKTGITYTTFNIDNYTGKELKNLLVYFRNGDSIEIDITEPERIHELLNENSIKTKHRISIPVNKDFAGRWLFKMIS
jgi:hypothetical protein